MFTKCKEMAGTLSTTLYVQIWENRIRVVDIKSGHVFDEKPFVQIETLKNGRKKVVAFGNKAYLNSITPFLSSKVDIE